MANHIRHFAIEADDLERARAFYEAVFGWAFHAWGPPNFYQIRTGPAEDPGLLGALQERREPLSGTGMRGFECTVGVDDLDAVLRRVDVAGGARLTAPYLIQGVGVLVFIADSEGNRVGVMQYDPPAGGA